MPCYNPITAVQYFGAGGEKIIRFGPKGKTLAEGSREILLPCGRCIGCRLERARQWAVRCMDEARIHDSSTFVTLTYNDANLPENKSVSKKELQNFFRKLRKKLKTRKISYFACGEYGEQLSRPHYHAIIFGWEPRNKKIYKVDQTFGNLYTSPELEWHWTKGFSTCGAVTKESAGYVARYTCKKITGENAEKHYKGLTPEFQLQSTKPAIGKRWLEKYWNDVYPLDYKIVDGHKSKPPRYYDKVYEKILEEKNQYQKWEELKEKRIQDQEEKNRNNEQRRFLAEYAAANAIRIFKMKNIKRRLENE